MAALIPTDQIGVLKSATTNVMALRLVEQETCQYYGVIFSQRGLAGLTRQDMSGFLSYEHNHRWREINRENVTRDMERLRVALNCLIDETRPIETRLDLLDPGRGELAVPHLGKAKLTPILLVTHPTKYGVWNDYSERALSAMGVFPDLSDLRGLGSQYAAVNQVLVKLAEKYNVTLWWLDLLLEQISRLIRES